MFDKNLIGHCGHAPQKNNFNGCWQCNEFKHFPNLNY